jgi:maleate isomerase
LTALRSEECFNRAVSERRPPVWSPDGWEARTRIGLLTPHADIGPECEFQAMAPPEMTIHATRVPFGAMAAGGGMDPTIPLAPVRAFAESRHLDDAVDLLAAAPLDAIAFGFTSSAYVIGHDGEAAMIGRLAERSRGIPVVATVATAVEALRVLRVERLAVINPPWFDAELDALGADYFAQQGFDVVYHAPCSLPSDQHSITPAELCDWVRDHLPDDAEGVFIGGNGFRAVGVIESLEHMLGRRVLTANQVLLWGALRAAGVDVAVSGYGQLFTAGLPPIGSEHGRSPP